MAETDKDKPAAKKPAKAAKATKATKAAKAAAKPAKKAAKPAAAKKPAAKKPAKKAAAKKPAAKKPAAAKAAKPAARKPAKKTLTLRIRLRSFDYRQLDQATEIIVRTVSQTGDRVRGPIPLPITKTRYDLLRSPHVDKDSREQIEIRTYHRLVYIPNPSAKAARALEDLRMPIGVMFNMRMS